MSKMRKGQTAKELMDELGRDPNYLRLRAEKDEKFRLVREQLDALLAPILLALSKGGFPTASLQDLVREYAPLPYNAVVILADCLSVCTDERIQESIVRAMGATKVHFDGQPLATLFDSTRNEGLRFAILNSIALVHPVGIDEWIESIERNDYYRKKLFDLGYRR
jgi:hypothetical protein